MSPILGIIASGRSAAPAPNSYESIATVYLAANQNGVTFSSIPSTYKHLQLRASIRSARTGSVAEGFNFQLNGVTTNSYYYHRLYGDGTTATADNAGALGPAAAIGGIPASSATANDFGAFIFDILDYTNTNKYKTTRALLGYDNNGSGTIFYSSGLLTSTSAISSIYFYGSSSQDFAQYSSFALYGVKG